MKVDVALSPYYGWAIETLLNAVCPDTSRGEEPELPKIEANRGMGAPVEVDYLTSREPREVRRSHLNYVVPARKSGSKGYDPREQKKTRSSRALDQCH